jgi:ArsR family transcriptional regulator
MPASVAAQLQPSLREMYLQVFNAASESIRLQILLLVASSGAEEYHCSSLEDSLPIGKSTISYHMKILSAAGLISVRREGKFFRYKVRRDVVDYFLPGLLDRLSPEGFSASTQ